MTKIMLVEDDKSLREIYGVRLLAEGYEIISAGNGEEALAMAVKEHPDLILSDVMMPKISGFDMLDILRSTPETKDIKVIMMTALSSEDQRARGETLGANRYLVKSQVGIEDVVRTVHDVLVDVPAAAAPTIQRFGVPAQSAAIINQPVSVSPRPIAQPSTPPTPAPEPVIQPAPLVQPSPPEAPVPPKPVVTPIVPTTEPTTTTVATPVSEPISSTKSEPVPQTTETPATAPAPQMAEPNKSPITTPTAPAEPTPTAPTALPQPTAPFSTAPPSSLGDRIINPITPVTPAPDISAMMSQELHDGSETNPTATQ